MITTNMTYTYTFEDKKIEQILNLIGSTTLLDQYYFDNFPIFPSKVYILLPKLDPFGFPEQWASCLRKCRWLAPNPVYYKPTFDTNYKLNSDLHHLPTNSFQLCHSCVLNLLSRINTIFFSLAVSTIHICPFRWIACPS